jgi:NADH-quinone oxidoreductase subunit A
MIFDLEIIFLFPWVILLDILTYVGFFSMIIFLIILIIGFVYEWMKGALNWE